MKDVNCPYCNVEIEICHDDGFGYEEGELHEYDCYACGKNFVFETSIVIYHEAFPADCLNGAEHKFEKTHTYPVKYAKLRCEDCGLEKEIPQ